MSSQYIDTLRTQLIEAAAREQRGRRRARVAARWRTLAVAAAAVAALAVGVTSIDLGSDERPVKQPPDRLPSRTLFGGSLEPGVRYVTRALDPQISFSVTDSTWFVRSADQAGVLELERRGFDTPGQETAPHGFLVFARPGRVTDPRTGRAVAPPRDPLAWLRRHPDLRAGRSGSTTVAGKPARYLETTVAFTRPAQREPGCEDMLTAIAADPTAPREQCTKLAPGFGQPNGVRTRWIVVPLEGGTLMITIEAWRKDRWDSVIGPAEGVLASLRIGRIGR